MKVSVEKIDNNKMVLELEVAQSEVAKAFDKAYRKLANGVNVPGFRKGKVPRAILEMRLGKEVLKEEAFEILAPQVYHQAISENKIDPVSNPEIEIVTFEENSDLVFKATVFTKPEVKLGQYKEIAVPYSVPEVTDEQIEAQLDSLRNRNAKMVVVEDAVIQNGDFAIIDFEGFIDNVPFKGGEGKAYPLEIGSGTFIPGFEEQLLGAKSGEQRDINVSFPEDYHAEELAGKPVVFKVTVQDIKRKEMPDFNDDFAKDSSDFDTLKELKDDIKNKLEQTAKDKAEDEFEKAVLKQVVENTPVDVPDVMVEERIDNMVEDLNMNLQNRGMQLTKYLEYVKMDMQTLRDNYKNSALYTIKTDLILEQIAREEDLKVTSEDINNEVAAMAQAYGASPEDVLKVVREPARAAALSLSILRRKAMGVVLEAAIKE